MAANPEVASADLRLSEARGRWVLLAMVLGSSMAFLDSTVVNVALPTIGRDLSASLGGLQWVVSGYTLSLAGLILLGGSLGDRLGRRKVFLIGVVWFALASALCGLAPSIGVLIGARVLQGVGGALLTPGSLAIIQASFVPEDRSRAVGAWSGLGGVAGAIGPLLGGWLVQAGGWRWGFFLNLPLALAVLAVTIRHVPETRDPMAAGKFDIAGSALAALALAGITYALIEAPAQKGDPLVLVVSAGGGVAAGRAPRRAAGHAAARRVRLPSVQRGQYRHVPGLRRARRRLLPARPADPGGGGLLAGQGGPGPAADHRADAGLLGPVRRARAAHRAALADDDRDADLRRGPAADAADRPARLLRDRRPARGDRVRHRPHADRRAADGDRAGQRGRAACGRGQRRQQCGGESRRAAGRGRAPGAGRPRRSQLSLGAPVQYGI